MSSGDVVYRSLEFVVDVYKGFRDELLEAYGNVEFTVKDDRSQVTELDIKIEKILKERLAQTFPEYGFQGEETGKSGNANKFWLVDPIDGTSSFIRGLPNCTNMAALIIDRQPVAAVIYDFINNELYTAVSGQGAFKNGVRINVSSRAPSSSLVYNHNPAFYAVLREILLQYDILALQPMGASGRSFSLVAEGKIDGAVVIDSLEAVHDRAPGALIILEAGGAIMPLDNSDWNIDTLNYAIASPDIIKSIKPSCTELQKLVTGRTSRQ